MRSDFTGRVAVVTGAAQGIGLAAAQRFAEAGARTVLTDWNFETAEQEAQAIRKSGHQAWAYALDVTDPQAAASIVEQVEREVGPLEILVNNAGFDRPGTILKVSLEDFDAVLSVHLKGTLHLIKATAPGMMARGYGKIVNVASIYGKIGAKGEAAYTAAKAAMIGLTRSAAREMGSRGVYVNAVLPGLTATPTILTKMAAKYRDMIIAETPLGRIAQPEEVAEAIAFLASNRASFITGVCLEVSGGWGM